MKDSLSPRKARMTSYAQDLRKHQTKEENHLWHDFLKTQPYRFRRQKVFGNYIVDFYCACAKLAVELDGSQHYEPEMMEYDEQRTKYLNRFGITVLRFSNLDIWENFSGVCEKIEAEVIARIGDVYDGK